MDGLFDALDDFASDRTKLPTVCMAAKWGVTVLQKYYGLSDDSQVFRIAMSKCNLLCYFVYWADPQSVLHPAYKTMYFRNHKWPEDWIKTAVDLLHADWEKNYKPDTTTTASSEPPANEQVNSFCTLLIIHWCLFRARYSTSIAAPFCIPPPHQLMLSKHSLQHQLCHQSRTLLVTGRLWPQIKTLSHKWV